MDDKEQIRRYREQMGSPATERQTELGKAYHSCCGVKKPDHAPLCQLRRATRGR